jgi:hypothetical protein
VPWASRLELYLPAPEKLPHAVRMRVLDASLAQEPVSLPNGSYLAPVSLLSSALPNGEQDRDVVVGQASPSVDPSGVWCGAPR